ncbi:MAG: TniQ family protein [Acinetobacter sp.]|nr:TniQ family protein [Acinetobacter sp.]
MSWLLPLEPYGLGTEQIEALPSYLYRLAISHGVTTGQLLGHITNRYKDEISQSEKAFCSVAPVNFIRPNTSTKTLINLLSLSTGQSRSVLSTMTFLALEDGLNRSNNTFTKSFRWCAICFEEALKYGIEPYCKLSWLVLGIDGCILHNSPLRTACPTCGAAKNGIKFSISITICAQCNGELWIPMANEMPFSDPMSMGSDVLELIHEIATKPELKFPAGGVSKFVSDVYNSAWKSERELELWKKIPRDECIRFDHSEEEVTLLSARRIAFRLDVTLSELLLGNSKETCKSFCFGADFDFPKPIIKKSRIYLKKRAELLKDLRSLKVEEMDPPPTLTYVSKQLKVSVGALRYHFFQEVNKILIRRSEFSKLEQERVILKIRSLVLDTVVNWAQLSEKSISRKAVLRYLYEINSGAKHVLRKEINCVFDTLGMGDY